MRILIVDDSENSLQSLSLVLADLGYEPVCARSGEEALGLVEQEAFPMVITDIRMPGMDGLVLLERLKARPDMHHADVVILTGHGDMETAVKALRSGAYDYLNKPINARELAAVVARGAEHQSLLHENKDWRDRFEHKVEEATGDLRRDLDQMRSRLREVAGIGRVVARSTAMRRLVAEARIYHSDPSVPVLIEGETGTGKEILARLVHFGDAGDHAPFVAINCSAIPAELFESELFGHEAGAYTGSTRRGAKGKLELAAEGTLFLDEVAEMPLNLQPKLLRVLEERIFYRVGGVQRREFKARVVCAANRDLAGMVSQGRFRRDLYHRLLVGHMVIPPLRERPEDMEALADFFLLRESQRKKKRFTSLSKAVVEQFRAHDWPGNVRELENTVERAVLTGDGTVLEPRHVAFLREAEQLTGRMAWESAEDSAVPRMAELLDASDTDPEVLAHSLPEHGLDLESWTDALVHAALARFQGNKSRTADYLGISRFALHRRLQKQS